MTSPINYFSAVKDPRVERTKEHLLIDIIFITISAVICGSSTWEDIANYGKAKQTWLKQYLQLPNGIQSHDTFNRLFSAIDPNEFEACFLNWIKDVSNITSGEIISIDGKTIRGSRSKDGKSVVHMVSAWAHHNQLSLGQVKVADKGSELRSTHEYKNIIIKIIRKLRQYQNYLRF